MIPPAGEYRYEILDAGGAVIGVEEERLSAEGLSGVRTSTGGANRYELEARFGADGLVASLAVRYARGPFERSARYEVAGDHVRGTVGALAARNPAEAKLGRFREIDADLIVFKAMLIARARGRGQTRFTGRVAAIDPNTLVAASRKQTWHQRDDAGLRWTFEPAMGESEEFELDGEGRIVRRVDRRGVQTVLRMFTP
jgi:hypothetical protein